MNLVKRDQLQDRDYSIMLKIYKMRNMAELLVC